MSPRWVNQQEPAVPLAATLVPTDDEAATCLSRSLPWWLQACSSGCGGVQVAPSYWWPLSSGSPTRLWEFALQIFAPEVNIRVDLLLFHPILLITGVLGFAFGLASRKGERGPGS